MCTVTSRVVARGGDTVRRVPRPQRVERALLISALVAVRAEVVALGLHDVGWHTRAAVGVKVLQGGRHGGRGHAGGGGDAHHAAPARFFVDDLGGKLGIEEERAQRRVAVVRLLDAIEEASADDAATLPDAGELAEAKAPLLLSALGADEVEPLSVRHNLGRVERVAHVRDELLLAGVGRGGVGLRGGHPEAVERAGHVHAVLLEAREEARVERRRNGGNRHRELGGLLHRPLAGALHPRLVEDLVDDVALGLGVGHAKNVRGDLDEVRFEFAQVPFGEDVLELVVGQAADVLQDVVRLGDELHVAVLDAVVHHLDEVARTALADVRHARPGVDLRRDLLDDVFDVAEGLL
mmetsp:Transcript_2282/g.9099  ORF Transcript_2282/g.9099 Transcript_2282/m.9099 type:complete len:351 (+) Transcript_2282:770-1822(+)